MARGVGIDIPEILLVHRDQVPEPGDAAWPNRQEWAYAIRRFHRPRRGERVHMEDFAQVRGIPVGDAKYQGSYESVASIIMRAEGVDAYLEFIRRIFFSYAVGNGDLHLKNVSLLYADGRRPRLAPAYDLLSTAAYAIERTDELALTIDRSRRLDRVTPETFAALATRVGAPVDTTVDEVRRVASRLEAAWDVGREQLVSCASSSLEKSAE